MLRHRLLDLVPDPIWGRAVDWYWPRREPEFAVLAQMIEPGTSAIDIGTWWGPWTSAMAKRAEHVYSFEPQPRLAGALAKRAPTNVTVHQVALSDRTGRAQLWMPRASRGLDALASIRTDRTSLELEREGTVAEVTVETATLDGYDLHNISFIKIDVEGQESEVLKGAALTLERERPSVLVEIEQRHHEAPIGKIFETFREHGYHGWFLRGAIWEPLDGFDVDADQTAALGDLNSDRYINNFLFTTEAVAPQ